MNREITRHSEPEFAGESLADLLSRLASNSAALVRDEIDLVKQELRENFKALRRGIVTAAVGVAVSFVSFLILCAAAVIALAGSLGWPLSALTIGAGLASIGGIIGLGGLRQLKRANLKPEKTTQASKEDKQWLKEKI